MDGFYYRAPNYLDMMGTTIGITIGWNYLYIIASNYLYRENYFYICEGNNRCGCGAFLVLLTSNKLNLDKPNKKIHII